MKHCPACNFSFPDFHRVCDFDGSELVFDPEKQSLMKLPRSRQRTRSLKSPMLLTSLAVLGIFVSAVAIGYLESPGPSIPAVATKAELTKTDGVASPRSSARKMDSMPVAPQRGGKRLRASVTASKTPPREKPFLRGHASEAIAQQRNTKRSSGEKSTKIAAILKTTWKVLKKPFDF